jgi:hypothetical protein
MTLRGTVVSFDAGTYTSVLRIDGSTVTTATAVKTARNIAAAELTANRRVLVDTGNGDADDWLVIAAYT